MATATFSPKLVKHDGYVRLDDVIYPPLANRFADMFSVLFTIVKGNYDTFFLIHVGLVCWDTSSLPAHAVIESAVFRAYVTNTLDADGRSLTAEWYEWGAGEGAGDIGIEDGTITVGTDAHAGTALASVTEGVNNDFALTNLANISLTGYTGLRLHLSGGEPAGVNELHFASEDHESLPGPQLIVTYDIRADYSDFPKDKLRRDN